MTLLLMPIIVLVSIYHICKLISQLIAPLELAPACKWRGMHPWQHVCVCAECGHSHESNSLEFIRQWIMDAFERTHRMQSHWCLRAFLSFYLDCFLRKPKKIHSFSSVLPLSGCREYSPRHVRVCVYHTLSFQCLHSIPFRLNVIYEICMYVIDDRIENKQLTKSNNLKFKWKWT